MNQQYVLTVGNGLLAKGGYSLGVTPVDPYNPLDLPPYTIRLKFTDGVIPSFSKGTAVQVSSSPNVWDLTYENVEWRDLLRDQTSLIEVLGANTSSVISMDYMFYGCTSLTAVPLFDTSSVTDMISMFRGCTLLTSVPLFDTSSVASMDVMFYDCTSLTTVPLFDTSSATGMSHMFHGCTSLTAFPLFDTSSARDMSDMFGGCTSLTAVPLFDTGLVTSMASMFFGCTSLTAVPLFDTSSVTRMDYMLFYCTNVASGSYALYQQASSQSTPPTNYTYCFGLCGVNTPTGAAELAQIPTSWGGLME